jgi:hypothetical protein
VLSHQQQEDTILTDEKWRFEKDTAIVEMMDAHYAEPIRKCFHEDGYMCARSMIKWMDEVGLTIVPKEWADEAVQPVPGEVHNA